MTAQIHRHCGIFSTAPSTYRYYGILSTALSAHRYQDILSTASGTHNVFFFSVPGTGERVHGESE